MNQSFFCFQSLKYVSQPNYSYWCWAANRKQMIKDLQEDDLTNRVVIDNINNYKSSGCYSESSEIPNGCNIALKEDDFKSIFSLSGFNATEINDLNTLKDFDFVKQTLINKLLNHKNSYKIL